MNFKLESPCTDMFFRVIKRHIVLCFNIKSIKNSMICIANSKQNIRIMKSKIFNNVININSERLFREAEEELYYLNNINSAYKKLKQSVLLTPNHLKSIIMLADIAFLKGHIRKALELYNTACQIKSGDFRIYASIANCYNELDKKENALKYCEFALGCKNIENYSLFNQLLEIKIELLISKKDYEHAYLSLLEFKKQSEKFDFNYDFLHNKIVLQRKLLNSNLKIV